MAAVFQHLRAFHAIALEGGVSRAARRLNVSQPTLSQQLKALEERHGVVLFEGRKVPLKLTAAGRELFALTQRLFGLTAEIDELLGDGASLPAGVLRLGADNPFYAAKTVALLRDVMPGVEVKVRMGNAREMMQWIADAQIDAALASDPPVDAMFNYEPVASDVLVCALPADHPLTDLALVPVAALDRETLLLREPTSKTRAFTERVLASAGIAPAHVIELHSRETIREGIAIGLGISLFFATECPPDARIAYRPLDGVDRSYRLQCHLVFQRQFRRNAQVRALLLAVAGLRAQPPTIGPINAPIDQPPAAGLRH